MSELAELRVENDALRDALQLFIIQAQTIVDRWSGSSMLAEAVDDLRELAERTDAQFFDGDPDQQDAESSR